jgi:Uma2 family endonuclease
MTTTDDVLPVTAPAVGVPGPVQGCWTYEAYAAIPDDGNRYEIIDGVLYVTPAPGFAHQNAVLWFGMHLRSHVQVGGLGVVLVAPFDVDLGLERNVVQPDVLVVLNEHRDVLTDKLAVGAPDLVIEVSSPSTATYDRRQKLDAYAKAGVREYWIADPHARTVEPLWLEGGEYVSQGVYQGSASIPSRVVPDLAVAVEKFFA